MNPRQRIGPEAGLLKMFSPVFCDYTQSVLIFTVWLRLFLLVIVWPFPAVPDSCGAAAAGSLELASLTPGYLLSPLRG